jgi:uncharacterized protein (TIGR02246 family)
MTDTFAAYEAINRLLTSYALFYDSGDLEGAANLFTKDCEFLVRGRKPVEGRSGLQRYFERVHAQGASGIHLVGPALIDLADGGRTATIWQSYLFLGNGSNNVIRGMYRDVAVLERDQWLLHRRDVEVFPGGS